MTGTFQWKVVWIFFTNGPGPFSIARAGLMSSPNNWDDEQKFLDNFLGTGSRGSSKNFIGCQWQHIGLPAWLRTYARAFASSEHWRRTHRVQGRTRRRCGESLKREHNPRANGIESFRFRKGKWELRDARLVDVYGRDALRCTLPFIIIGTPTVFGGNDIRHGSNTFHRFSVKTGNKGKFVRFPR